MQLSFNPPKKIFTAQSNIPEGGRGVFAAEEIEEGEVVEISPVIVLEFTDFVDTKWNLLFEYYFWMDDFVVLALGYGSLYNHSKQPNCKYEINHDQKIITITALRKILKKEELSFNYNPSAESKAPLWFERQK